MTKTIFGTVFQGVSNSGGDVNNKGFFATEAALIAAHPVGENGWHAIVGATDTVWIWDEDTTAWVNSGNAATVISVHGRTGEVDSADDDYTASQIGFTPTNSHDSTDVAAAILENPKVTPVTSTTTTNIDYSFGDAFRIALDTNIDSLTFSNLPAALRNITITLVIVKDDSTTEREILWPTNLSWTNGTPLDSLKMNSEMKVVTLISGDGGSSWFGSVSDPYLNATYITIDTRNTSAGSTDANSFRMFTMSEIPGFTGGTRYRDCGIDFGDGTVNTGINTYDDAGWEHTYATAGIYTIKITGDFVGFTVNGGISGNINHSRDALKIVNISQVHSGFRLGLGGWRLCGGFFSGATNLTITALNKLNTSGLKNFSAGLKDTTMTSFPQDWLDDIVQAGCDSLEAAFEGSLINPAIHNWNTQDVEEFFAFAKNNPNFNRDLGLLDFSSLSGNASINDICGGTCKMSTENTNSLLEKLSRTTLPTSSTIGLGECTYTNGTAFDNIAKAGHTINGGSIANLRVDLPISEDDAASKGYLLSKQIESFELSSGGSGYVDATYDDVTLTGGNGSEATASITVSGGIVTTVTIIKGGKSYDIGDSLSADNADLGGSGSGLSITVERVTRFIKSVDGRFPNDSGDIEDSLLTITTTDISEIPINTDTVRKILITGSGVRVINLSSTASGGNVNEVIVINKGADKVIVISNSETVQIMGPNSTCNLLISSNLATSAYSEGSAGEGNTFKATSYVNKVGIETDNDNVTTLLKETIALGEIYYCKGVVTARTAEAEDDIAAWDFDFKVGGYSDNLFSSNIKLSEFSLNNVLDFKIETSSITSISGLVGGAGYIDGTYSDVPLIDGNGTDATAEIVVSGGAVTSVDLINTGINYEIGNVISADNLDLGGSGSGFEFTVATVSTCNILGLDTLVAGSGYTNGSYTDVALTGGNGSGATADITVAGGVVTAVTLVDGGSLYINNEVLSANSADIGGSGSGFSISVDGVNNMDVVFKVKGAASPDFAHFDLQASVQTR